MRQGHDPRGADKDFCSFARSGGSSSTGWKILPHCRLWGLKNIHCGKSGNRKQLTIKIRCGGLDIALSEFLAATALDARGCRFVKHVGQYSYEGNRWESDTVKGA